MFSEKDLVSVWLLRKCAGKLSGCDDTFQGRPGLCEMCFYALFFTCNCSCSHGEHGSCLITGGSEPSLDPWCPSLFIYLWLFGWMYLGSFKGSSICLVPNEKIEGLWWYFPSKSEIMKGSFLGGATRVICEMGFILQATVVAAMASQQLVWLRPDLSLHCPVHDNRIWILIKMCHLCRIKVVGGPNKMSHAWSTKHNL